MNQNSKKKYYLSIVLFVLLVVFGAAAVVISQRLFQTRDQAVAPNVADQSLAYVIQDPNDYCTIDVVIQAEACDGYCDGNDDCGEGLECDNGTNRCRNPQCSGESDCTCPIACNESCSSSDQCESGFCDPASNTCRNEVCASESSCACPSITPSPTPTATPTVTPSPIPTPTDTPTPIPTATPTPMPFECIDLELSNSNPQLGDEVLFTCELSRNASFYYEFQYNMNETGFNPVPQTQVNQANGTATILINEPGRLIVECRGCTDSNGNGCSDWTESY